MILKNRLKELRARDGLNQSELAKLAGVSRQSISLLERGEYTQFPYETKDITIDVHLVSQTQADMRLLHTILYTGHFFLSF